MMLSVAENSMISANSKSSSVKYLHDENALMSDQKIRAIECLTLPKAIQTRKVISDPLGYHLRGFKISQKILKRSMNRAVFGSLLHSIKKIFLRRTSDFEWDFLPIYSTVQNLDIQM